MAHSYGSTSTPLKRASALLVTVAAAAGLCGSLYGYVAPLTGITRSFGALLACVACAALLVDGIALWLVRSGVMRTIWLVLGVLGVICTCAAAYFLHAWYVMGALAFVLLGLIVSAASASDQQSNGART